MGRQQRLKQARRQSRTSQIDPARDPFDPTSHPSHQAKLDIKAVKQYPDFECLVRLPTTFERDSYNLSEPFLIQLFGNGQGIKKAILTECKTEIDGEIYDHAAITTFLENSPRPYLGMREYDGIFT